MESVEQATQKIAGLLGPDQGDAPFCTTWECCERKKCCKKYKKKGKNPCKSCPKY